MNRPEPDNKTPDLLMDLFFSDEPYDPCDWLDPRNEFLFEDDWINEPHKDLDSKKHELQGLDVNKDDPSHED